MSRYPPIRQLIVIKDLCIALAITYKEAVRSAERTNASISTKRRRCLDWLSEQEEEMG